MRRWILPLVLLGAAAWGVHRWSVAPPPRLPDVVWTPAPYRGPRVAPSPGVPALEAVLGALTPDPPIESVGTSPPDPQVCVIPTPRWDRRISTYLGWRTPVPRPAAAKPADAGLWGARWYRHTGVSRTVDGTEWAEYRAE